MRTLKSKRNIVAKSKLIVMFNNKKEAESLALSWKQKTMRLATILHSANHSEVHLFDLNEEELNWVES